MFHPCFSAAAHLPGEVDFQGGVQRLYIVGLRIAVLSMLAKSWPLELENLFLETHFSQVLFNR